MSIQGKKRWRSGKSTRLPPMWLGFKSRRGRHMMVEFDVGFILCGPFLGDQDQQLLLSSQVCPSVPSFTFSTLFKPPFNVLIDYFCFGKFCDQF